MDGCHCERCAPLEWERAGLLGMDALPNDDGMMVCADAGTCVRIIGADGSTVPQRTRLDGRDLYLRRLGRDSQFDYDDEPEEDDDREPDEEQLVGVLDGRDAYIARLSRLAA